MSTKSVSRLRGAEAKGVALTVNEILELDQPRYRGGGLPLHGFPGSLATFYDSGSRIGRKHLWLQMGLDLTVRACAAGRGSSEHACGLRSDDCVDRSFPKMKTVLVCDIKDPITHELPCDLPKHRPQAAEARPGISLGDQAFFGPEAEKFFIL